MTRLDLILIIAWLVLTLGWIGWIRYGYWCYSSTWGRNKSS